MQLSNMVQKGGAHVWQELDDEVRLLVPYDKDNLNEVVIGFAFEKKYLTLRSKGIQQRFINF